MTWAVPLVRASPQALKARGRTGGVAPIHFRSFRQGIALPHIRAAKPMRMTTKVSFVCCFQVFPRFPLGSLQVSPPGFRGYLKIRRSHLDTGSGSDLVNDESACWSLN